jgi:hypothetical protein
VVQNQGTMIIGFDYDTLAIVAANQINQEAPKKKNIVFHCNTCSDTYSTSTLSGTWADYSIHFIDNWVNDHTRQFKAYFLDPEPNAHTIKSRAVDPAVLTNRWGAKSIWDDKRIVYVGGSVKMTAQADGFVPMLFVLNNDFTTLTPYSIMSSNTEPYYSIDMIGGDRRNRVMMHATPRDNNFLPMDSGVHPMLMLSMHTNFRYAACDKIDVVKHRIFNSGNRFLEPVGIL